MQSERITQHIKQRLIRVPGIDSGPGAIHAKSILRHVAIICQNSELSGIAARSFVLMSPLLLVHIAGGAVGLLSGGVSMSFRKGSRWHGIAGNVFFVSMLTMSGMGMFLALLKSQPTNVFGGALTFYLVATAWLTARRRAGKPGLIGWGAFLAASALSAVILSFGIEAARDPTGMKDNVPAPMFFFLATVALFAAMGDLRMLLRGGITGRPRITRHLWRMCFGWFIASGSIFIARPHLFPAIMARTHMLLLLGILPLLLMLYWLFRIGLVARLASAR